MMESYSFDIQRILIGDLPLGFFAEIALRTTILYSYTLVIVRMLGKRSAGELTVIDIVMIVALGSSVGDPMLYPDVPVLHALLVITLVVVLQRLALYWSTHNKKVDQILKGTCSLVVVDGVLNLDGLESANLSSREVFQMARQKGYCHLGEIRRMYIETDDKPSVFGFERDQIRPGLPFEPPWEVEMPTVVQMDGLVNKKSRAACANCGYTACFKAGDRLIACPHCQQTDWIYI